MRISTILTPDILVGNWVLVHAGFAITQIDETDALETWDYLRGAYGDDFIRASDPDSANAIEKEDP